MLTCRLCWLAEVGAAPRAICCDLCLWATVLSSSWAMRSKKISVENGFSLQPKAGQKCVCVLFLCVWQEGEGREYLRDTFCAWH